MFRRNLNIFFPYYALLAFFTGSILQALFGLVLSSFIDIDKYHNQFVISVQVIIALILVSIWVKYGLSPKPNEKKQKLSKRGHKVVFFGNAVFGGITLFLGFFAVASGQMGNTFILIAPFFAVSLIAWFSGVILIWIAATNA